MQFAILDTTILERAPGWRALEGVDLVVEDGRIAACGPKAAVSWPDAVPVAGRRLVVTPGFVNAHCHSAEVLARGRASTAGLQDWLATLADIDTLRPDDVTLAVTLAAADQLRSGITAVIDHFRQMPARLGAAETAAAAWAATGMRATVALMVRDGVAPDGSVTDAAHAGPPPSTADIMALSRAWLDGAAATPGVVRALGPSAPIRCTEALLGRLGELARDRGVPLHMHVDETLDQASRARALYEGESAVARLRRVGALGPGTSLVHCVHLGGGDAETIAASGATVIHCPVANLRLGSGIAAIARLRDAGASLALATDGAASNDAQSITEVVKAALLVSRLAPHTADWLSPDDVLDMAFRPGPRPFLGGNDPLAGTLVPGAPADIAAFDRDDPVLVPANDLAAQIALAGGSLRARHVWIGGIRRLADGVPVGFDPAGLADAARARKAA